jgi:SAM-dependent methyltransferase
MKITRKQLNNLEEIAYNLETVNRRLAHTDYARETGFVPMHPSRLRQFIINITENMDSHPISLELGCGTAGFTLMAASLGYPAYGIDANPVLLDSAKKMRDEAREKGLIAPEVPCEFALGNYFPVEFLETHKDLLKSSCHYDKAWKKMGNPYNELGIDIKDAGIIYTWPWPDEINPISHFLNDEVADSAVVVLPYYPKQDNLELESLIDDSDLYEDTHIGKKIHNLPADQSGYNPGDIVRLNDSSKGKDSHRGLNGCKGIVTGYKGGRLVVHITDRPDIPTGRQESRLEYFAGKPLTIRPSYVVRDASEKSDKPDFDVRDLVEIYPGGSENARRYDNDRWSVAELPPGTTGIIQSVMDFGTYFQVTLPNIHGRTYSPILFTRRELRHHQPEEKEN